MDKYVLWITLHGTRLHRCDDGDAIKLETLQDMVGGYIETVPSTLARNWAKEPVDSILLVVNEEGKMQCLSYNEDATELLNGAINDVLVGNVVLLAARGDDLVGFSKEACKNIMLKWGLMEE